VCASVCVCVGVGVHAYVGLDLGGYISIDECVGVPRCLKVCV